MTDEEFAVVFEEFLAHYNNDVPSPEHEPLRFATYVRNWKYYKEKFVLQENVEYNK